MRGRGVALCSCSKGAHQVLVGLLACACVPPPARGTARRHTRRVCPPNSHPLVPPTAPLHNPASALLPPPLPTASQDHQEGVPIHLPPTRASSSPPCSERGPREGCAHPPQAAVRRAVHVKGRSAAAWAGRGRQRWVDARHCALAPAQLVCPSLAACFCACGAVSCIRQHLTTCFPSLCRCLWADGGHGERPAAGQGAREGVRG